MLLWKHDEVVKLFQMVLFKTKAALTLVWICSTTCCTTSYAINSQQAVQHVYKIESLQQIHVRMLYSLLYDLLEYQQVHSRPK